MTRLALAVVVATAGITATVTHHHRRPVVASEQRPEPLRASRAQERQPLPGVNARMTSEGATPHPRRAPVRRGPSRPAPGSGLSDVTMYCATGNRNAAGRWPRLGDVAVFDRSIRFGTRLLIAGRRYLVEDWIGSGSQFDIFGGDDDGCEHRALTFGRQHLLVQVIR
jgi:hypothetical protein